MIELQIANMRHQRDELKAALERSGQTFTRSRRKLMEVRLKAVRRRLISLYEERKRAKQIN